MSPQITGCDHPIATATRSCARSDRPSDSDWPFRPVIRSLRG
jgi:hypothetical protein